MNTRKFAKRVSRLFPMNIGKSFQNSALFIPNKQAEIGNLEIQEDVISQGELLIPFPHVMFHANPEKRIEALVLLSESEKMKLEYNIFHFVGTELMIHHGTFEYHITGNKSANMELKYYPSIRGKGKNWTEVNLDDKLHQLHLEFVQSYVKYAFAYIILINYKSNFVVESSIRRKMKKGMRQNNVRPTYFVDTPRVIRDQMKVSGVITEGNGKPLKIGHERRAHYRRFKSDRFINMKGQKIKIPATWVGPKSYTDPRDPRKYYEVRLDL
jgi:hypothetical protein